MLYRKRRPLYLATASIKITLSSASLRIHSAAPSSISFLPNTKYMGSNRINRKGELTRRDRRLGCKIVQQKPLVHGAGAYSTLTTGSSALFPSLGLNDPIEFPILSVDKDCRLPATGMRRPVLGLVIGTVVLTHWYKLFQAWIK